MDKIIILLSILLHMIVIALILSLVFYFLISVTTYRTMTHLIINQLVNLYKTYIIGNPKNTETLELVCKSILLPPEKMYKILDNLKEQTEQTTTTNRLWYRYCVISISTLLLFFIIIVILTKSYSNPEYYIMVMETMITFLIVGGIEMMFFLKIASKYVPVLPTEIILIIKNVILTALNDSSATSINTYILS